MTKIERLEGLATNPFFHKVSTTLHFPFTFQDVGTSQNNLASLVHEYLHFLQATTTVFGIYNFIGLTERLVFLFNAVQGRDELKVPLRDWAMQHRSDEKLAAFADNEGNYEIQIAAAYGEWTAKGVSATSAFAFERLPIQAGSQTINRWHLTRRLAGALIGIPVMPTALSEAQAECVGVAVAGTQSNILAQFEKETSEAQLFYTTVPGYVHRRFPTLPLGPTVFFLTDFALMSFAPDLAFRDAVAWLARQKITREPTRSEWTELHNELKTELDEHEKSLLDLLGEIERSLRVFRKHDHEVMRLFVNRLELGKHALGLRAKDPMFFFPWGGFDDLRDRIFEEVPLPRAHFTDGIRALGPVSDQGQRDQAVLSAASHFIATMEGGEVKCPLLKDRRACLAERDYACTVAPWTRGDIGNGNTCEHGMVGQMLQIVDATVLPFK